jgi:hypothetical protein
MRKRKGRGRPKGSKNKRPPETPGLPSFVTESGTEKCIAVWFLEFDAYKECWAGLGRRRSVTLSEFLAWARKKHGGV